MAAAKGNVSDYLRSRNPVLEWIALAGFCCFFLFVGLNGFGLVGPDEPRYAQVAHEMLQRRDWITPTLGGVPWLEKPVLYYWEAMLSYLLFGVSDWAARLPGAFSATTMIVGIFLFFRRFRPGAQLDAALMTLTSAAVIGFGRAASTDIPLAANFTLAMLAWFAWVETDQRRWLAGFYFFSALGMLAKGPIAVFLAMAIIGAYALGRRVPRLILRTLWLPGIALFLAVVLPWYVALQMQHPEFFRVFFLEHNLARFSSDLYRHQQPLWYYLPVALVGWLPWTALILFAIMDTARSRLRSMPSHTASLPDDTLTPFLLTWMLVPIAFFSLSHSKLPGYILPALPAGAMLVANRLWAMREQQRQVPPLWWLFHSVLAGALIVPAWWMFPLLLHQPISTTIKLQGMVAAVALSLLIFWMLRRRGLAAVRIVTLLPVVIVMAMVLRFGAPLLDATVSARAVHRTLTQIDSHDLPVAIFGASRETEFGLHFYRNHPIASYDRGEIPAEEHLLVARNKSAEDILRATAGRRVIEIGNVPWQKIDLFWIQSARAQGSPH